jgi:hypothetical protein
MTKTLLLLLVMVTLAAGAALAAIRVQSFTAKCVNGQLVSSFKVTGLGNQPTANFTVAADAVVDVQCINRGGNRPPGQFSTITGVSATGTFPVRNGQTTGSLTTDPLDPSQFDAECPPGFVSDEVDVVEFQNVRLIGPNGQVLASLGTIVCE